LMVRRFAQRFHPVIPAQSPAPAEARGGNPAGATRPLRSVPAPTLRCRTSPGDARSAPETCRNPRNWGTLAAIRFPCDDVPLQGPECRVRPTVTGPFFATVAQLAEQCFRKAQVISSSLIGGSSLRFEGESLRFEGESRVGFDPCTNRVKSPHAGNSLPLFSSGWLPDARFSQHPPNGSPAAPVAPIVSGGHREAGLLSHRICRCSARS
jgi:hypothetical protein